MKHFFLNPYGLSVLAIAAATLARVVMTPLWGAGYSISYCPAILFSVWVGGWQVGLLSFALFVPGEETGISQIAAVTFFLPATGGIVLMAESWRGARVQAEAQAASQQALRESLAEYRATFDNALGIAPVGLDGHRLKVSDRFCGIVGYSREGLLIGPVGTQPLRELLDILDRALTCTRTVMAELLPSVLRCRSTVPRGKPCGGLKIQTRNMPKGF